MICAPVHAGGWRVLNLLGIWTLCRTWQRKSACPQRGRRSAHRRL